MTDLLAQPALGHPLMDTDAIEHLPIAAYVCESPSGRIVRYNRRAVELWGQDPLLADPGVLYCGAYRLYTPDNGPIPPTYAPMVDVLRTGAARLGEEMVVERPDGSRVYVRANINPLLAEDGRILGAVNTFEDISDRVETLRALRVSEERYARAAKTGRTGVWEWEIATNALYISPNLKSLLGYTDEELPNRLEEWCHLVHPDDVDRVVAATQAHLRGETPVYEVEARRRHRDGRYLWFLTRGTAVRDEDGQPVGMTGSDTDITERKRVQDEVQALNVRLHRAIRETHHRVKNNLQVIAALVDIQGSGAETMIPAEELRRLGQHVRGLAVIHDLLTAQTRDGADVEKVSARTAVSLLLPVLQTVIGERAIHTDVEDVEVPARQASSLTILVNELVSNAVKHGRGRIDVLLRAEGGHARLEVRDEGPGFPEGFDAARSANTGIELIESVGRWDLQGEVEYANLPAGGACVSVRFPLA
jgi:PAS domain S-box-containing protein